MDLAEIRQEINRVDERMKELLLERMEYSAQVARVKKQTGESVYVPEREEEILRLRQQGVPAEYALGCRAFFKQMIGISRTYQYSKLAEGQERLLALPDGEGEAAMEFVCSTGDGQLFAALNAAALAGLAVKEMRVSGCRAGAPGHMAGPAGETEEGQLPDGRLYCKLKLAGDFSGIMAKAAVLQILEETEEAFLLPGRV